MRLQRETLFKFLFVFLLLFTSPLFADELIIEPDAGRAPLLSAMQHAKSSVELVMYGFTDERFMDALIAAKNQGKNVQVLLEPSPYRAADENERAIHALQNNHVNLQWPDSHFKLTHQKTFLFDQQTALVMSFNLTHSSFTRERNFALLITNPEEVREIQRVFSADWAHQTVSVENPNLVWSPDNSREKILRLIRSAKSDIDIYAQDISDYQTIGALAKAARAGVKVRIIMSARPEKFHNKKLAYLRRAGVLIHNSHHYYIHAKVMIVDHERALVGSINFTKPSMDSNRELSVITDDREVIQQLSKTFVLDWQDGKSVMRMPRHRHWTAGKILRMLGQF